MPLKIDQDIRDCAKHFGVDPALIQAVNNAEGNLLKAVQCSIPTVKTRYGAIEVTCRSAVHAMSDFIKCGQTLDEQNLGEGLGAQFIRFWAVRWAPVGALDDPTSLNANWPRNVLTIWRTA